MFPAVNGTITLDRDLKTAFENMQVSAHPLERPLMGQPPPPARVEKDGSFSLPGLVPGRWRLFVNGAPGFIKSVSLNGQEIPPGLLDLSTGAAGPLKVVIGTGWAELEGAASSLPPAGGPVSGIIWPAEDDRQQLGFERGFSLDKEGHFTLGGIVPGRYHACAVELPDSWLLTRNPVLLDALHGRCPPLELAEGSRSRAQIPFIAIEDLERIVQESEK